MIFKCAYCGHNQDMVSNIYLYIGFKCERCSCYNSPKDEFDLIKNNKIKKQIQINDVRGLLIKRIEEINNGNYKK